MFFSQIKNDKHKELALELAYLVAVSEDRLTKYSNDEYKILFKEYLSNDEVNTLTKYAEETDNEIFLEKLLSDNYQNLSPVVFYDKTLPTLSDTLKKNSDSHVQKYSNNSEVKKEIITKITEQGFDILSITPEIIQKEISHLPKIKAEILRETAKNRIESIEGNLTSVEKKIILAELLSMAHSNAIFCPEEFELIKYISNQFNIDEEYIEEFNEPIKQISLAIKEIIELINE